MKQLSQFFRINKSVNVPSKDIFLSIRLTWKGFLQKGFSNNKFLQQWFAANHKNRNWKPSITNLPQQTLLPFLFFVSILAFLMNQFLFTSISLLLLFFHLLNEKMFDYMISKITIQSDIKEKRFHQISDEFQYVFSIQNNANFKINFDLWIVFNDNISLPMESKSTLCGEEILYQNGVLHPGLNEIKIPMMAQKRGSITVEELNIHITSFFGLEKRIFVYQRHIPETYFNYPKVRPFKRLHAQWTTNYGTGSSAYGLLQDRMSVAGHQDYMNSHSFRDIDWNASAKLNKLQAKTYDYSVNNAQFFMLDISKGFGFSRKLEEYLEILTSWIYEAEKADIPYGFAINAQSKSTLFYHLDIDSGVDHKERALALIATIPNTPFIVDMPRVLAHEVRYEYLVSSWYHIGNKNQKIENLYKKLLPLSKIEFIS